jgi:hypothetical protein
MAFKLHKVQAWSVEVPDRPGAVAAKLEVLLRAGANLEFIFTRPHSVRPDDMIVFLAPISGPQQVQAAQSVGLAPARDIAMLCVEGGDHPGLGYEIMSRLAIAGVNLRGMSISALEGRFAAYLAFDNPDVVTQAIQVLASVP